MLKELIVIRHGQTDWNAEGRLQGTLETQLNKIGHQQAQVAAQRLRALSVDVIFSSPLIRARQTAEIIADAVGAPIVFRDGLREKHFGLLQGMQSSEIDLIYGDLLHQMRGHLDKAPPEGESNEDVIQRLEPIVGELAHYQAERIVVVTHGAVARVLYKLLAQPSEHAFFNFKMRNCQMIHFTPERNGLFSCKNINHTSSELYSE